MTRRRWVRVLVAVDAVLVVGVLVVALLVLVRPGSPGAGVGAGSGASPTAGGAAPGPSPTPTPGPPRFRLPSGNIACAMTADGVTCTVASATFTPPPGAGAGCTGAAGHTVVLDAKGVSEPCVPGPAPTVAGADVPTLFYGETSTVGRYTCTSATNGVTCTDAKGVGFRLARASLTTLP